MADLALVSGSGSQAAPSIQPGRGSSTRGTKRRASKRRLTEERREQNRRSQRVWREKQKLRRDEEVAARVRVELERLREQTGAGGPGQPLESEVAKAGREVFECSSITDEDESLLNVETDVEAEAPENPDGKGKGKGLAGLPETVLPLKAAVFFYVPPLPGAESYRDSWPNPDAIAFKTYTRPPGIATRENPQPPTTRASNQLSPTRAFAYPRRGPGAEDSSSPSTRPSLPSPYRNHLQLVGESCWSATMTIARPLGITMQSYINDRPSPFSSTSIATLPIHTMPGDLRPTAHQLIVPHPSYLDCIPFPHFRSMAIYLLSVSRLDHASLFSDLMHDGMVCWGRDKARAHYGRSMGDGVAWSKRSWEVRRWFWRKWGGIARLSVEAIDAGAAVPEQQVWEEKASMTKMVC